MREPKDIIINNRTLEEILELHKMWLNNEDKRANLQDANLQGANLQDANLRYANLQGANLQNAYLQGAYLQNAYLRSADLDFSCLPLWCGSLETKFDEKHLIQFLFHTAKPYFNDKSIVKDEDLKELLESELFRKVANKFHRAKECGEV